MAIITRQTGTNAKGSPLTAAEMDANLIVLQDISSSFTAVSSSVSNLSSLTGTLSGQFTGSVLVSGSNSSLIISGSTKIASGSLGKLGTSNKVLVVDANTGEVG